MPVVWNPEMDQKFFLAVVKHCNVKIDFAKVSEEMTKTTGNEITQSALQNRYHRIKKEAGLVTPLKPSNGESSSYGDGSEKPKIGRPPKKGVARPIKKPRKRPYVENVSEDDDEDTQSQGLKAPKLETTEDAEDE